MLFLSLRSGRTDLCEQEGVLFSIQVYVSTTLKGKVSLRTGIIDGLRTLKEEIVAPLFPGPIKV